MALVGVVSNAVRWANNSDHMSFERKLENQEQLLFGLLDCVMFIFGEETKFSSTVPILQMVLKAKRPDLKKFAILSFPSLINAILCHCWEGVPETLGNKLIVLANGLLEEMHR